MKLLQILRRRLHGVVHLVRMWPVAYTCGALPYRLSTDNVGDLNGPCAGGEAGFARFLQLALAIGVDGEGAVYLGDMASMDHLPLPLIRRK